METNERIGKLVEARDAVRLLDDLANLPPAVMAVRFDSDEKRKLAFTEAVDRLFEFVHDEIAAVDVDAPDLAGELADVKAENARLTLAVAKLGKMADLAAEAAARTEPSSPPAATGGLPKYVARKGKKFECNVQRIGVKFRKGGFDTAQAAHDYAVERIKKAGGDASDGAGEAKGKLPKFVKAEGDKFSCQVRRKGLQFYKDGFATAQAAHDYAVEQIEEAGGDASDGRYDQRRSNTNQGLPRFVYEQNGFFDVLCNRKNMYFRKSGFATADKASEWAEAEFDLKTTGITTTPTADPPPSAGPAPGNRGRPRTRAELKEAINESRERTEKRKWFECGDCEKLLGYVGDAMPESCPGCGSKEVVKMEGVPGGDAVEIKTK